MADNNTEKLKKISDELVEYVNILTTKTGNNDDDSDVTLVINRIQSVNHLLHEFINEGAIDDDTLNFAVENINELKNTIESLNAYTEKLNAYNEKFKNDIDLMNRIMESGFKNNTFKNPLTRNKYDVLDKLKNMNDDEKYDLDADVREHEAMKARENNAKRAREEAEAQKKAERLAREEAKAREEEELRAREEADAKAREEAERQNKKEAEKNKKIQSKKDRVLAKKIMASGYEGNGIGNVLTRTIDDVIAQLETMSPDRKIQIDKNLVEFNKKKELKAREEEELRAREEADAKAREEAERQNKEIQSKKDRVLAKKIMDSEYEGNGIGNVLTRTIDDVIAQLETMSPEKKVQIDKNLVEFTKKKELKAREEEELRAREEAERPEKDKYNRDIAGRIMDSEYTGDGFGNVLTRTIDDVIAQLETMSPEKKVQIEKNLVEFNKKKELKAREEEELRAREEEERAREEAERPERDKKNRGLAGRIMDSKFTGDGFGNVNTRTFDSVLKKIEGLSPEQRERVEEDVTEKEFVNMQSASNKQLGMFNKLLGGNSSSLLGVLKGIHPAVGIAVAGIGLLCEAMKKIAEITVNGIKYMGELNTELYNLSHADADDRLADTNNTLTEFTNNIDKLGTNLELFFANMVKYSNLMDALKGANILMDHTVSRDNVADRVTNNTLRAMINSAVDDYGQTGESALSLLTDIVGELRNLGYTDTFSNKMASAYYSVALDIAKAQGNITADNVKNITNNLMNGKGSTYGYTNDDDTLKGWMYAERGIDAYRTKMTDAKMEYYRLQMLMEFYEEGSSNAISKKVKQYKELNALIQNASAGMYSFEKVISMTNINNSIPDDFDEELISNETVQNAAKQDSLIQTYLDKIKKYRQELKKAYDDGIIDEKTYTLMNNKLDRLELEVTYAKPETLEELAGQFEDLDAQFQILGDYTIDPDIRLEAVENANGMLTDLLKDIYELNETNGRIDIDAYLDELKTNNWKRDIDEWLENEAHTLNVDVNYTGKGDNPDFDGIKDQEAYEASDKKYDASPKERSILLDTIFANAGVKSAIEALKDGGGIISASTAFQMGNMFSTDGWSMLNPLNNWNKFSDNYENSDQDGTSKKILDSLSKLYSENSFDDLIEKKRIFNSAGYADKDVILSTIVIEKDQLNTLTGIGTGIGELNTTIENMKANTNLKYDTNVTNNNTNSKNEKALVKTFNNGSNSDRQNVTENSTTNYNVTNNFTVDATDTRKLQRQISEYINTSIRTNNGRFNTGVSTKLTSKYIDGRK